MNQQSRVKGADSAPGRTTVGHTLNNLQALRALAAIMVVLHHNYGGPFIWGHYGVDVFFVISGFIMVHAVDPSKGAIDFYTRRVIRIVPLYWSITLGLFAVALLKPGLITSSDGNVTDLIKSLAFIPYWSEDIQVYHPIIFVGWTLNYEMFFYLLFGSCLWLQKKRQIVILCLALLLTLVALGFLFDGGPIFRFYTSPILLEFAAGMALALGWHKLKLETFPAVMTVLVCLVTMAFVDPYREFFHRGLLIGPVALVLVAASLAAENAGHYVKNRLILLLGAASYSLYLSHVYVLGLLDRLPIPGVEALWVLAVPVASILLYEWFERPVGSKLQKLAFAKERSTTRLP